MNFKLNQIGLFVFFLLAIVFAYLLFQSGDKDRQLVDYSYTKFIKEVEAGRVLKVEIKGDVVRGYSSFGTRFKTAVPLDSRISDLLIKKGVDVNVESILEQQDTGFFSSFLSWLPFLLMLVIWIYFFKQAQSGGGSSRNPLSFGKSKAKLKGEGKEKVTFNDVAGVDEAKEELLEVVNFLKDPGKFSRLGAKIPRGLLLVGPPGTGKTLLARAVAGESGVPFFSISGSDFVEMFVGVGASRVRDMFEQAKKNKPCIIFIDEIDAVGRHRGAGLGGGNDEREQTLNQLLVEMDGFETNEGVIIIAATNRPDVLDPALLRPGRFDRQVIVPNPDINGREQILKVHIFRVKAAPDIDLKVIARGTPGFSGADLMNIINEAALLASNRDKKFVTMKELEDAKEKILMGSERKSMVLTEEEKKLTAYHEAGHALLAFEVPDTDPVHKATIVPRGRALGLVMQLPERDKVSMTRSQLLSRLIILMGGRVAEEEVFGYDKVTSGAASDIEQATKIARSMITKWGLSDLGPVLYSENQEEVFLGHSVARQQNLSDAILKKIDDEIFNFIKRAMDQARKIITEKREQLNIIAEALIEFETLSGKEMKELLKGIRPDRGSQFQKSGVKSPLDKAKDASKLEKKKGDISGGDISGGVGSLA